jgi:hypothetical protein
MHEAELLEREDELEALDALIDATAAGDGRLLIVDGPAGIGSGSALRHSRGHADQDGHDHARGPGGRRGRQRPRHGRRPPAP